jgi:hypothetical protein
MPHRVVSTCLRGILDLHFAIETHAHIHNANHQQNKDRRNDRKLDSRGAPTIVVSAIDQLAK